MEEAENLVIKDNSADISDCHLNADGLNVEFKGVENDGHKESELVAENLNEGKEIRKSFVCLICGKKFKHNAGRYNHMKQKHNTYTEEKANVRCLERGCSFSCTYKEKLQIHLSEQHDIVMEILIKTFKNLQDFCKWKEDFEKQEKSRFVKKSGSRIRDEGVRVAYYYCSRSGSYVSNSTGIKCSKKKGTSKSNNYCTASITCVEMADGSVEVKVCSTHYGHDTDLQHLRLTISEKLQIADQLSLGIPRDVVLDNLRSSASSDIDKIHLIDLKDIKNIEKAFGIQGVSNEKSTDMYSNLKTWAISMQSTEHCPILYYEETGKAHTTSHDVTIMLLTTGQMEMLNKFGCNGIFYVVTYSTSNKFAWSTQTYRPTELHVTTLMLIDDMNEAVPVSFMITNKIDGNKYLKFFESLRARIPNISAHSLFTDDENVVYEKWCLVFQEEPNHLWSNRFVDSDWRDNLISIPDEEVQVSIYEQLYLYLESTNKEKLENSLESYAMALQDNPVTNQFGIYFTSRYVGSEMFWAGCYGKKFIGINAQLNMELLFNEIAELGLKRHFDRNLLVRVIQRLLKLVSENHCVRHSKLQRQIQDLPTHHSLGISVKPESIIKESDCSWRVKSLKDPENIFSIVNQQYSGCKSSKCMNFCLKCNTCVHMFYCTCSVYSYDRTMCKHIHAVASNFNLFPKEEPSLNAIDLSTILDTPESKSFCKDLKVTDPKLILLKKELWKHRPRSKKQKVQQTPPENTVSEEKNVISTVKKSLRKKRIIKKSLKRRAKPEKKKTNTKKEIGLKSNEPKHVKEIKVIKKIKRKSKADDKLGKKVKINEDSKVTEGVSKEEKKKVPNKRKRPLKSHEIPSKIVHLNEDTKVTENTSIVEQKEVVKKRKKQPTSEENVSSDKIVNLN